MINLLKWGREGENGDGNNDVCELCGEFSYHVSIRNGVTNRGYRCVGRGRASSFAQQIKAGIIQSNTPVMKRD